MSKKASKNISHKVRNGTTLQTRDEYFKGQGKFHKPGYENKGLYRRVVVVDSNRHDDLAVVKLGTSSGTYLPNYQSGKSRYHPIIRTKDVNNNPIRIGRGFVRNRCSQNMSNRDVQIIKCDLFSGSYKHQNKKRLRELKGRK